MKVTVKLFASLRQGRFDIDTREFKPGTTIDAIRRSLKIADKDMAIVFVNGIHADPGHRLSDGDVLSLFPPSGGG